MSGAKSEQFENAKNNKQPHDGDGHNESITPVPQAFSDDEEKRSEATKTTN